MLSRQVIIETIRDLHRRNEPLNITAVKRRHPALMKAVYAIKPYWGWKRALEAAGLTYSDIRVELQDYCECEICHAEKQQLSVHLRRKHGVEVAEYWADYPDAAVTSEEITARFSRMNSNDLPHWEPLWTAEYVLDRLWQRYEKGLPINSKAFAFRDPGFLSRTCRYFGSLDHTFRRLGLNPDAIRRTREALKCRRDVLDGIAKRRRLNLPLNPRALIERQNESPNCALYFGAIRLFGSWRRAIEAAGLNYDLFLKQSRYPSSESVLREIRRRHKTGLSVGTIQLRKGEHRDHALYTEGLEYYGSWEKALSAAGVKSNDIDRRCRSYRRLVGR